MRPSNAPNTPKPGHRRRWVLAWIAWGLLGLAIEIPASLNHLDGDTLSEQVWAIDAQGQPGWGAGWYIKARRILMVGGWAAITVHFFTEWV